MGAREYAILALLEAHPEGVTTVMVRDYFEAEGATHVPSTKRLREIFRRMGARGLVRVTQPKPGGPLVLRKRKAVKA